MRRTTRAVSIAIRKRMPSWTRRLKPGTPSTPHLRRQPNKRRCGTGKKCSALPSRLKRQMTSASYTESATFTITHAKHMAAKVAADLKRIQRLYKGEPSDLLISWWEEELIELLKEGVLAVVAYGYQRM